MERVYQNHVEVAPEFASWVYQYEDPEYFMLRNEPLNHIGPMHYCGADHDHSSIPHGPLPVFLQPESYMTDNHQSFNHGAVSAANFLPYGSQFNYIQQPMFYRNHISFQDDRLVLNSTYNRGLAVKNFRGQLIHAGTIHNPDMFDRRSLRVGCGDNRYARHQSNVDSRRFYSHNEGHPFPEPCFFHSSPANANFSALSQDMVDGYSHPVFMSGRDWTQFTDGIIQGTCNGANLSQFDIFPVAQRCLQQYLPTDDDDRILSKGANEDERYRNEDPHRSFEHTIAAPNPFGWGQALLPIKNKIQLSGVDLSSTSGRKIPNEPNSSQRQHGYKSRVRTNPTKSSVASSKLRALGSTSSAKQSGQRGKTLCNKSTHSVRDPAPPYKSGNQKVSAPRQVWQKKIKARSSASQSKRSRRHTTPIYHITWDGFDEPCDEPVGQSCPLCKEDISYAPSDDEFEYYDVLDEPSKLPDVAVLPCGHVFHSQCLQLITPEEESGDPPCYLCSSGKS